METEILSQKIHDLAERYPKDSPERNILIFLNQHLSKEPQLCAMYQKQIDAFANKAALRTLEYSEIFSYDFSVLIVAAYHLLCVFMIHRFVYSLPTHSDNNLDQKRIQRRLLMIANEPMMPFSINGSDIVGLIEDIDTYIRNPTNDLIKQIVSEIDTVSTPYVV